MLPSLVFYLLYLEELLSIMTDGNQNELMGEKI